MASVARAVEGVGSSIGPVLEEGAGVVATYVIPGGKILAGIASVAAMIFCMVGFHSPSVCYRCVSLYRRIPVNIQKIIRIVERVLWGSISLYLYVHCGTTFKVFTTVLFVISYFMRPERRVYTPLRCATLSFIGSCMLSFAFKTFMHSLFLSADEVTLNAFLGGALTVISFYLLHIYPS